MVFTLPVVSDIAFQQTTVAAQQYFMLQACCRSFGLFFSPPSLSYFQGGLFAKASALPPHYTQAMMAGQGVAGLAVSLTGLFTTLASPDDTSCITGDTANIFVTTKESDSVGQLLDQPLEREKLIAGSVSSAAFMSSDEACATYTRDDSTLAYFGIAVAVLMLCMISYPVLERLPLVIFYTQTGGGNGSRSSGELLTDNNGDEGEICFVDNHHTVGASASLGSSLHRRLVEAPPVRLLSGDTLRSDSPMYEKTLASTGIGEDVLAIDAVNGSFVPKTWLNSKLATISSEGFAVFVTFMVTLSVFPGATSQIVSSRECQPGRSRFFASDIFVLFSFVSFNTFDLLGRIAAGLKIALPNAWLPKASLCRVCFVPLLLMCRTDHSRFRNLLTADAFPLIIMPVFAFTNGYVGSLSMMAGSQKSAWAGTAMVLCLSLGLLAGCILSFLVLFMTTSSS